MSSITLAGIGVSAMKAHLLVVAGEEVDGWVTAHLGKSVTFLNHVYKRVTILNRGSKSVIILHDGSGQLGKPSR